MNRKVAALTVRVTNNTLIRCLYLIRHRKEGQMEIIKKSKLKQLKACKKACQRIYEAMSVVPEDEHGNASSYRWDKVHTEILQALAEAGYGRHFMVLGTDWEYEVPWKVEKRC